jgi:hypothetical protein
MRQGGESVIKRLAIQCSWEGQRTAIIEGVECILNGKDEHCDYAVDLTGWCTPTSLLYPPGRRIWVTMEPTPMYPYDSAGDFVRMLDAHYKGALMSWHRYLRHLSQWKPFRFGSSWVWGAADSEPALTENKLFGVSGIFSGKKHSMLHGYTVRRALIAAEARYTVPTMIYHPGKVWRGEHYGYPLPVKIPSLRHMFHLAVENCREEGYFTEKLLDAHMMLCVPLYWGDREVDKVFDTDGMILLDEEHMVDQINALTEGDYHKRLPALRKNRDASRQYCDLLGGMVRQIKTAMER